jgi:hypothetical protein
LYTDQKGIVGDVVGQFKKGNLESTREANADNHFGMNTGAGFGRGGGMGRGMGGGRGQGCGRRMSGLAGSGRMVGGTISGDRELEDLRLQADSLNKKLKEVVSRIDRLEKR